MPEGPSLFLLDPYRGALLAQSLEEGLLQPNRGTEAEFLQLPALEAARDKELQATILQQLLLFDRVLIVQNENKREQWERLPDGVVNVSWRNLREDGLVEFVSAENVASNAVSRRPNGRLWFDDETVVPKWRSLVAEQFVMKKKISHIALFDFLVQSHHPDFDPRRAIRQLPQRLRSEARKLLEPQVLSLMDMSMIAHIHELGQVEEFVKQQEAANAMTYVSLPSPKIPRFWRDENSSELVEIVIHELFKDNIEFALPSTVRDARDLRKKPEIGDFRTTFLPWLDTLRAGRADDEIRLRKEVWRAAKCFKLMSAKRSISGWSVIGSIAVDLLFENPLAGGAFHLAADWFRGRLEHRARWVGLAGRERRTPVTIPEAEASNRRLEQRRRSRAKSGGSPEEQVGA
jgi:hypothetical protein